MTDLTRRKFLTGAPAVAAVAVVGIAAALVEPASFPVITSDDSGEWWRDGDVVWTAQSRRPILTINRMPRFVNLRDIRHLTPLK